LSARQKGIVDPYGAKTLIKNKKLRDGVYTNDKSVKVTLG